MWKLTASLLLASSLSWGAMNEAQLVEQFHEHREASLRAPESWLTLVGLFWLTPGKEQTIGSASSNDFVVQSPSAPARIGKVLLSGQEVKFTDPNGHAKLLKPDDSDSQVRMGSVSFFAIMRGDKIGLRVKDSQSPVAKSFRGLTYFPVNASLHFANARFIKDPKQVPILNMLGQTNMEDSPGLVELNYQGKTYHLRALTEGDSLFFLFKDPTNKSETYQAGRMLNTPLPKGDTVDVDFNFAYNPPCTFTQYATCPLAPKENELPFPVAAGEKRYGHGHP
jgi:uncharacterized protein (DUF1684 family)